MKQLRDYLSELTTARQLEYIENTWGVRVSMTLQLALDAKRQYVVVGSVDVPDMFHRGELGHPPAVILTAKLNRVRDLRTFTASILALWEKTVRDHNDTSAA